VTDSPARTIAAEFIGTALLLAAIVGSGIMGERLTSDTAIALLANTIATGAALVALILTFGPISGAHFNPVVTLSAAWQRAVSWRAVPSYVVAQVIGGIAGVLLAHVMFGAPLISASQHARAGSSQLVSEFVATFGLISVIWSCARTRPDIVPFGVATYIVAAYWFTASTSFANPAVTLARSLTDTFAGIRPVDAPGFIAAQLIGGTAATLVFGWLHPVARAEMPSAGAPKSPTKKFIFACVHSAGRSQMAAAFFNAMADPERALAVAAGTEPADRVHPEVIEVMREVGIELRAAKPQRLTDELAGSASMLVTMGCGEACPVVPGLRRDDWALPDPKGQSPDAVRKIRDEVRDRVRKLIEREGIGRAG
jgi:glycerol uptake facilitator-like aquaporin/protein-tyrosine-phosphatase